MSLLEASPVYKPFNYPWAYEAWLTQQRIHWLPEEVPLADDVKDWHKTLTESERNLLSQIFRFFTQADVEVNNCYMRHYSRVIQPTEVQMMLAAFSNTETIHVAAYSHLLDTIGMPETEYHAFLDYKEMKDKYDYMQQWGVDTKEDIAKTMAHCSQCCFRAADNTAKCRVALRHRGVDGGHDVRKLDRTRTQRLHLGVAPPGNSNRPALDRADVVGEFADGGTQPVRHGHHPFLRPLGGGNRHGGRSLQAFLHIVDHLHRSPLHLGDACREVVTRFGHAYGIRRETLLDLREVAS